MAGTGYAAIYEHRQKTDLAIENSRLHEDIDRLQAENEALHSEARTDHLTGKHNRRALIERFDELKANGKPFGGAMFDLDKFKYLNDTLGQTLGDVAICHTANFIDRSLRDEDASFMRLGGDEFFVLYDLSPREGENDDALESDESPEELLHRVQVPTARIQTEFTNDVFVAEYNRRVPQEYRTGLKARSNVYDPTHNLSLEQFIDETNPKPGVGRQEYWEDTAGAAHSNPLDILLGALTRLPIRQ